MKRSFFYFAVALLTLAFGCTKSEKGQGEKIEVTIKRPEDLKAKEEKMRELEARVEELTALVMEIQKERQQVEELTDLLAEIQKEHKAGKRELGGRLP